MFKRSLCVLLAVCLLLGCTACAKKVNLEEVKSDMVTQLQLVPFAVDAAKAQEWYGITADNCEQAVVFTLTENLYPAEVVMVKAVDDDAAELIAATMGLRLANLKTQSPDRTGSAMSCEVRQDGRYVAMFFSAQHDAMLAIYNGYMQ